MITSSSNQTGAQSRPWLMETVAWCAVGLSAALAGIGVSGEFGWASLLAMCGSALLIAVTMLTETSAARLLVHAEARLAEGAKLKGWLTVLGFIALTGWNVTAGHMGAQAIDRAGVADQRAPLVAAFADAQSQRETAEEALDAFDGETRAQQESLALALRGAFEAGYVSAGARAAQNGASDTRRDERRRDLARAVAEARSAERRAQAALAAAPNGRPDQELWALALVLELLKGALVWFATGHERRRQAELVAFPESLAVMSIEQVQAYGARGASMMGSSRQELIRRRRAAEAAAREAAEAEAAAHAA